MIFSVLTEQEKLLPFYIKGIGTQEEQEHIDRPDGYYSYQWIYCSEGSGVLLVEGNEHIIREGTGFYLIPGLGHSYRALEEPWVTNWIMFDGTALPVLFNAFKLGNAGVFRPESDGQPILTDVMKRFNELYDRMNVENINRIVDTTGALYDFLLEMKDSLLDTSGNKAVSDLTRLMPVINYMELNYSNDLSLNELGETIGVSSHYLCKLFKSGFGISPFHYLIRLRLQAAKELLLSKPDMKVKDIAEAVGYHDTSYFCTIFRKQETVTPKGFRRLHGKL